MDITTALAIASTLLEGIRAARKDGREELTEQDLAEITSDRKAALDRLLNAAGRPGSSPPTPPGTPR